MSHYLWDVKKVVVNLLCFNFFNFMILFTIYYLFIFILVRIKIFIYYKRYIIHFNYY